VRRVRTVPTGPWTPVTPMTMTLELGDDLAERIESHLEEGETPEEFVAELVSTYETEGAFLREGYSE